MLLTVVFFVSLAVLFGLGRWLARGWPWPYLLGGLLFGIYNEFFFEGCWTYSPKMAPFIWRDVPLVVVLGWCAMGGFALSLTDRLLSKRTVVPRVDWHQMGLDILIFVIQGSAQEVGLSRAGLWQYNVDIQKLVPVEFLGYIGVGLLMSSLGRRFRGRPA
jgi:hypothetical protein